jgi:hypothetical protein
LAITKFEPSSEHCSALLRRPLPPGWKGPRSGLDGLPHLRRPHFRHSADDFAGCGIVDVDHIARIGRLDPLAVDVASLPKQRTDRAAEVSIANARHNRAPEIEE